MTRYLLTIVINYPQEAMRLVKRYPSQEDKCAKPQNRGGQHSEVLVGICHGNNALIPGRAGPRSKHGDVQTPNYFLKVETGIFRVTLTSTIDSRFSIHTALHNFTNMWSSLGLSLVLFFVLPSCLVSAQFGIFEQMFGGQSFGGQQQQHQQRSANVASDSAWYRQNFEAGEHIFTDCAYEAR